MYIHAKTNKLTHEVTMHVTAALHICMYLK
jgi:hypothetical protein